MELGKDFRDLLELLNHHQVRYLAVGGFAVAVHGKPRYTKDLDLWVEVSVDNAKRIVAALDDLDREQARDRSTPRPRRREGSQG